MPFVPPSTPVPVFPGLPINASAIGPYGEDIYASLLDDLVPPVAPSTEAHQYIYEDVIISLSNAEAELYIYENVVTGVPAPDIWFITPTAANPGDTVFIVGTGFGASQAAFNGRVVFGSQVPVPAVWELVSASANAYNANRQIVPPGNVDPEHELVTFVVPNGSSSGFVEITTST